MTNPVKPETAPERATPEQLRANDTAIAAGDRLRNETARTTTDARSPQSSATAAGAAHPDTHLTMTDPYQAAGVTTEQTRSGNQDRQRWTITVDLGASINDHGVAEGADRQLAELRRLAAKTRDSGVTLMVQRTHTEEPSGQPTNEFPPGTLDRYIIRNGNVETAPAEQSHGVAEDTRSLLKWAGQAAPSDKIALISQGHGNGTRGLNSDTGAASLDEFQQAIKDGLSGSGHDHLDVLDLDRCLMGSAGVQSALHSVADHIVASEEVETGNGNSFDGQTLRDPVSRLLHNPDMTPTQLADTFVQTANDGANGKPVVTEDNGPNAHSGTDTLAHFDSSKYQQFAGQLGALGDALSRATQDEGTHLQIDKIIRDVPAFPDARATQLDGERDLKTFAERIVAATKNGTLNDADHSLAENAQRLLDALGTMTPSFHGDQGDAGYDKMGGLSAFIPHGTTEDAAKVRSPIRGLSLGLGSGQAEHAYAARGEWAKDTAGILQSADEPNLSTQAKTELEQLKAAQLQVDKAGSHDEFIRSFNAFSQLATNLVGGTLDQENVRSMMPVARRIRADDVTASRVQGADGWNSFVASWARS